MVDKVDIALSGASSGTRGQIVPTPDGKVEAPKNIIPNVFAARAIYFKYRSEHLKRIALYSAMEGIRAGNPPYNPVELAKQNLSHIANYNDQSYRALWERGALAFWNLLNEAETLVQFTINSDELESVKWADSLSRNWDYVIRQDPSFTTQVNQLTGQLVAFGISPVVWPDERDWHWRTIEVQRFFVPDQAQADVSQLTCICVESNFTAQYLWDVYEEFKDKPKDSSDWDIEQLGKFLLFRANTHAKTDAQISDMMDLQRRLQNGDLGYDAIFSDSIRVVSLLYKEYSGGISHYMFDRTYGGFLFKCDRQYKTFDEAFVIFTGSPSEFTIHSNRGLGHKIFAGCQANMQLNCSIVDVARWASTPLLKSASTGSREAETIRLYPGVPTFIGTSEFVENTMGANINQLIGASQFISSQLEYNTANSGDNPATPDKDKGSISPTEARMKTYKEFSILKHNVAHFYKQFDAVIRNMTVKMLDSKSGYPGYDYADEWKQRCIADGVPKDIFKVGKKDIWGMPRHLKVKATRVAGDGSTVARIMGLEALEVIAPDLGPKGTKEWHRQWVSATMGWDYVKAFIAPEEPDESSGGASLAGVENAVMRTAESPIFSPDNEHRSHIAVHLALAEDTIQKLQQQQTDAVAADKIFTVLVPHLGEHVDFVSKSKFGQTFVKGIIKPFQQVVQYAQMNKKAAAQQIQAQIKKQQEDAAAQEQVMNEQQRKDYTAKRDADRADLKVQNQVQRAGEANQNRAEVMREKVHLDAENKRLQVQLDADAKKSATESNVENKPLPELRADLEAINGETPAPYDMENVPYVSDAATR